jgi:hypothetical protein
MTRRRAYVFGEDLNCSEETGVDIPGRSHHGGCEQGQHAAEPARCSLAMACSGLLPPDPAHLGPVRPDESA